MNDRWKIRNKRQPNGRTKKTSSALRYERRREKAILSELPQVRHEQDSVAQTAPCQKGLIHRRSHEANHSESKKDGSIG